MGKQGTDIWGRTFLTLISMNVFPGRRVPGGKTGDGQVGLS